MYLISKDLKAKDLLHVILLFNKIEPKSLIEGANKISRQIETLRNNLTQTTKSNKEYDKKLKELQAQIDQKNQLLEGTEQNLEATEEDVTYKMNFLNQKRLERMASIFEIVKNQTRYKAYDSIATTGKLKLDATETLLRQ